MSHTYHIERLDQNGHGLSISESGEITRIEGVISGETVTAKIKSGSQKPALAVVSSIIKASSQRRTPPCPHCKQCGGCDLQHMTYDRQLQEKQAILAALLEQSSIPQLKEQAQSLSLPVASPSEFHYRQRIRLQVDERQVLGFHKRRSHACVAIETCMMAQPEINHCLSELRPLPPFQKLLRHTEALEILFDPGTTTCHLLVHFTRKPRPTDMRYAQELTSTISLLGGVFFSGEGFAVTGQESLSFELPPIPPHTKQPLTLSLETGGFCQVNVAQNRTLVQTVLDFCQVSPEDTILDLFCGMGNFSIPLAERATSVVGIEGQGSAIRSAIKNSSAASQTNTTFKKQAIHKACAERARAGESYDCVIIDPPRQGIPGLARFLSALCRMRLVYISCDPISLCRDLEELLHHGFCISKLQCIDMFPQTRHIETVVLLEKTLHTP